MFLENFLRIFEFKEFFNKIDDIYLDMDEAQIELSDKNKLIFSKSNVLFKSIARELFNMIDFAASKSLKNNQYNVRKK